MREIKYQVFDHKQNMMFDVTELSFKRGIRLKGEKADSGGESFVTYGPLDKNYKDSKRFSLREYTGLSDKNGQEIYEGDIVRDFDEGIISKVKFEDGQFLISDPIYDSEPLHEFAYATEIIGNIYENGNEHPHLLKEAK